MDTCFSHIISPKNAYAQAFEALDCLEKEFRAWHNFVKVVRGFQHNLLELLAFVEWWHNIEQGEQFCSPFCAPTHELIFNNGDLYANHAHWSIASYLIVPNNRFIDPNKRVNLSPRNMSRMDAMSIQPLVHSLHLWYYPPYVTDVCTDFELAARGYVKCLDTLIPTKGFKCMLDKQDNQWADEGTSIFSIRSGHGS
jgi:hypothetical protein